MRKIICTILALALAVSAGIPAASAAHHGRQGSSCGQEKPCSSDGRCVSGCVFTDADKDGICDNCKNVCPNCKEAKDENGDGICDSCGKCGHYTDENGDGICDRHGDSGEQAGEETAAGKHSHRGRGHKHHH